MQEWDKQYVLVSNGAQALWEQSPAVPWSKKYLAQEPREEAGSKPQGLQPTRHAPNAQSLATIPLVFEAFTLQLLAAMGGRGGCSIG